MRPVDMQAAVTPSCLMVHVCMQKEEKMKKLAFLSVSEVLGDEDEAL